MHTLTAAVVDAINLSALTAVAGCKLLPGSKDSDSYQGANISRYMRLVLLLALCIAWCYVGIEASSNFESLDFSQSIKKKFSLSSYITEDHVDRIKSLAYYAKSMSINRVSEQQAVSTDGEIEGRELFNLPSGNLPGTKSGLSDSCNNKICDMYFYLLSCKVIDIHLSKTCANYFLGYIFACSSRPSPSDVFSAPYACLIELQDHLSPYLALVTSDDDATSIGSVLDSYLGNIDSENCHSNCYQNYITASQEFYSSCYDDVTKFPNNNTYSVAANVLPLFSTFRDTNCAENSNGDNCFEMLYSSSTSSSSTSSIDLFDMTCSSYSAYYPYLCPKFSAMGCCFANSMTMVAQNQLNATDLTFLPPCLLRLLHYNCPAVDPIDFCKNGSASSMSVVLQGQVQLKPLGLAVLYPLPNVYDKTIPVSGDTSTYSSILWLETFIALTLQAIPGLPGMSNTSDVFSLFNVEIVNYNYYDNNGLTSSSNGYPLSNPTSDYTSANNGTFDFVVVVPGLSQKDVQTYKAYSSTIKNYVLCTLQKAYCGYDCSSSNNNIAFTNCAITDNKVRLNLDVSTDAYTWTAPNQFVTENSALTHNYSLLLTLASIFLIVAANVV